MPTYEYACKACEHSFEIVQSFSEDSLTTCPECAEDQLRKVYNAAGIIFKGDGWHIKDYGGSSSTSSTSSTDTSSDTSSSTSSTKDKSKKSSTSGSGDSAAKPAAG